MDYHSYSSEAASKEAAEFMRQERDRLLKELEGERAVSRSLSNDLNRLISEKMAVEVEKERLEEELQKTEGTIASLKMARAVLAQRVENLKEERVGLINLILSYQTTCEDLRETLWAAVSLIRKQKRGGKNDSYEPQGR